MDKLQPIHTVFKEWTRERAVDRGRRPFPITRARCASTRSAASGSRAMEQVQQKLLAMNPISRGSRHDRALLPKFRQLDGVGRGGVERARAHRRHRGRRVRGRSGSSTSCPWALFNEQYPRPLLRARACAAVFLVVKARARPRRLDRVPWYDWLLAAAGLARRPLHRRPLPVVSPTRWASPAWDTAACRARSRIVLVLEATRRMAGWALMWIALACILYAKFGLAAARTASTPRALSWDRIAVYLYLDTQRPPRACPWRSPRASWSRTSCSARC